ncbi:MAG: prenyltransferase [Candidatus Zixiibacteriota bacterium]
MVKVIDMLFAARPMLLLPLWSIYIIVFSIINENDQFNRPSYIILAGLTLLTAGAYFLNQIYDYKTDLINNKLSFLQTGKISINEMMAAYISVSVLGIIAGFIVATVSGIIFVIVWLIGYLYSAPPFRFKDRPIPGLLANAIGYGTVVPLTVPNFWEGTFDIRFYLAVYMTFMVASAYLVTLIPDREGDLQAGKRTLAVKLSDRMLLFIGMVLLARTIFLGFDLNNVFLIILSSTALLLFLTAFIFKKGGLILLACKLPILLMTLVAGYYNAVYLVFIIVLLIMTRVYYKKRFGLIYPRLT